MNEVNKINQLCVNICQVETVDHTTTPINYENENLRIQESLSKLRGFLVFFNVYQ